MVRISNEAKSVIWKIKKCQKIVSTSTMNWKKKDQIFQEHFWLNKFYIIVVYVFWANGHFGNYSLRQIQLIFPIHDLPFKSQNIFSLFIFDQYLDFLSNGYTTNRYFIFKFLLEQTRINKQLNDSISIY